MAHNYEWVSLKKKNVVVHECPSIEVTNHPLKMPAVSSLLPISSNQEFIESLNKWGSAFEEVDPLLRFEQMNLDEQLGQDQLPKTKESFSKTWSAKKSSILNKYTTGEKLTIVSSFLPGSEKALIRQVSNLNEKVKHRLEQLDHVDEGALRSSGPLTQHEFTAKIAQLSDEMKKAWASEQRVKAFKIAIQCAKLLSDAAVLQFYPSKAVLIGDVLDAFGALVFRRLADKSQSDKPIVSVRDIDPAAVPDAAKETCMNWMYKMASIRELLPRLYMELALLRCYYFTAAAAAARAAARVARQARGVGHPLVAVYLRVHLCRVAADLAPDGRRFFYDNFKEFLDDYQQIFQESLRAKYESESLTRERYLSVYAPAADWLLRGALAGATPAEQATMFDNFLAFCEQSPNNELLLYCLLSAFDSPCVAEHADTVLTIVQQNIETMVLTPDILACLGSHLSAAGAAAVGGAGGAGTERLVRAWWPLAGRVAGAGAFLTAAEPWLGLACMHLSPQRINALLRGALRRLVAAARPADDVAAQLQRLLRTMLAAIPDVEELFLMDAFMPLVELAQSPAARTLLARSVLAAALARTGALGDPLVVAGLMRLCCVLHDSITAMSVEDEVAACGALVCRFVRAVRLDDAAAQLAFYVDCRAAFLRLDAVLIELIMQVNRLSMSAGGGRGGGGLARAAAAYCAVSAPALRAALPRLRLHVLTGLVALNQRAVAQAEASFIEAIALIADVPESMQEDGQSRPTAPRLEAALADLAAGLLLLPDNVESECRAGAARALLRAVARAPWRRTDALYCNTLLRVLDLLAAMALEEYPYHIESVPSNDTLYGSDADFIESTQRLASQAASLLAAAAAARGAAGDARGQARLAAELLWRVVTKGDLAAASMRRLATDMWTTARGINEHDKLKLSILTYLKTEDCPEKNQLYSELQAIK